MITRTGPQACLRNSLYSSGNSSRPSLSTARLITCQSTFTSRTFSTSRIQREVIQANGQAGSNQKSTVDGAAFSDIWQYSFRGPEIGAVVRNYAGGRFVPPPGARHPSAEHARDRSAKHAA